MTEREPVNKEDSMRWVLALCAAVLFAIAPVSALAQGGTAKPSAPPSKGGKMLTARGAVTAVAADSLSVKGTTAEWTFTVDNKTHVVGRGAGTKSSTLKGGGKPTVITEFVKVGDTVEVKYHDMGTTKHASTVRVVSAKTPTK